MIVKNTAIYAIGNVIPKVIGFLLIPLYSKILSPDEYGIIGGITSLNAILAIVMTLAIDRSVFRLYWEHPTDEARKRYLGTIIIALAVVAITASLLLIFPLRGLVSRAYPDIPFFPYYVHGILIAALHTAGLVPRCYLQIRKKAAQFVVLSASEALVNTLTIVVFVAVLRRGAAGFFEAQLLVAVAYLVVYGVMTCRIAILAFDRRIFFKSVRFSLPMVPNLVSSWLMHSANRLILIRYATRADVGIFSMAGQLSNVMRMLSAAFLQSYTPYFFELAGRDGEAAVAVLRKYNNAFAQVLGLMVCLACTATYMAFDWIFDPRYAHVRTLLPAMVATLWVELVGGITHMSIYQHKRSDVVMLMQVALVPLHLGLNFAWIPRFGAAGAVGASAVTAVVGSIWRYRQSRRFFFVPYDERTLLVALAVIVCALLPFVTDRLIWQRGMSIGVTLALSALTYKSLRLMRSRPRPVVLDGHPPTLDG